MSDILLPPTAVEELYQSLIASRQHARQRLQAIAEIERTHRDTPLPELADLAATGALHQAGLDTEPARQPWASAPATSKRSAPAQDPAACPCAQASSPGSPQS